MVGRSELTCRKASMVLATCGWARNTSNRTLRGNGDEGSGGEGGVCHGGGVGDRAGHLHCAGAGGRQGRPVRYRGRGAREGGRGAEAQDQRRCDRREGRRVAEERVAEG